MNKIRSFWAKNQDSSDSLASQVNDQDYRKNDYSLIFSIFFELQVTSLWPYRKTIPKPHVLSTFITIQTLAYIYRLIGIELPHTENLMGFDLRKYNAVEAYRFCDFLAKQFQIGSKVKKSVEGLPLIIIEGDDAIRLTRMIYPFLTYKVVI